MGNLHGNFFGNVMSPHQAAITQVGTLEKLQANGAKLLDQSRLQLCENRMYGGDKCVALQAPPSLAASYLLQLPAEAPTTDCSLVVQADGRSEWAPLQPASPLLSQLSALPASSAPALLSLQGSAIASTSLQSSTLLINHSPSSLSIDLPQSIHHTANVTFDTININKLLVNGENSVVERNLFVNGVMHAQKLVESVVVKKLQRVELKEAGDLSMHLSLLRSLVVIDFGIVSDERYELRLVDSRRFVDLLQLVDGDSFELRFFNSSDIAGTLLADDSFIASPVPLPPRRLTTILLMKEGERLLLLH